MNKFEDMEEHVIVQSRLVSINSKFATTYLNGTKRSSMIFDFNNVSSKSTDTLYHTVAIQSAEIPASYYNVNTSNNVTSITRGGGAGTIVITMPAGNYDANTYLATFKTLYETAVNNIVLNISFSSITGKYSIQETGSAQQVITFNATPSTSFDIWGLGSVDITFPPFSAQAVPSAFPALANFLGVTKFKILSNSLAGDNFDSNKLTTTTLIDTISASASDFGLTIYNSLGRESFVKAKRIDDIDIQVLDQDNNFIDFNGINWTLTLLLNTHRRQTFSKRDATINEEQYELAKKALKKVDTLKEELEDVQFDII